MSSTTRALAPALRKEDSRPGEERQAVAMEDHPPNSRIFVVCGKAAEVTKTFEAVCARETGGEFATPLQLKSHG